MKLALKYKFNTEDVQFMMDRCLLLGEAVAMLQELGLQSELTERHQKKCEEVVRLMSR